MAPDEEVHQVDHGQSVAPPLPRRIMIYGVTGSGKTTLARRLSEATGIRWQEVDEWTWEPGWVTVSDEIQRRRFAEFCAGDEWILDTAYGKWLDIPLARVDLIVGLDYPRWFSLQRLFVRCVKRIVDQKAICNGNRERFRNFLSKDSILVWHFRSWARKRDRIRSWVKQPKGPQVIVFTSARATEAWLVEQRARYTYSSHVDPA